MVTPRKLRALAPTEALALQSLSHVRTRAEDSSSERLHVLQFQAAGSRTRGASPCATTTTPNPTTPIPTTPPLPVAPPPAGSGLSSPASVSTLRRCAL